MYSYLVAKSPVAQKGKKKRKTALVCPNIRNKEIKKKR